MNKYQKIAFGTAGMLAFATLIVWTTQMSGLMTVLALAFVVALLTLPLTWTLIITIIQVLCAIISAVGHSIGIVADEIVDWCKGRKAWLSGSTVPSWDSFERTHPTPTADELDVPSFLKGAMGHQNV
ncbi:hypothetical protein H7142_00595 [Candidatus Saccharibacteria bacterium]|nr:hypothetical protein [Candidatus Saccharibacteria bacterium]